MSIDDILKNELSLKNLRKNPTVYDILEDNMYDTAGIDLVNNMIKVFGENLAVVWFYKDNMALGGMKPYEAVLDGDSEKVKEILGKISYGIHS